MTNKVDYWLSNRKYHITSTAVPNEADFCNCIFFIVMNFQEAVGENNK